MNDDTSLTDKGLTDVKSCVVMPSVYREAIVLSLMAQGRSDVEVEVFDQLPSTSRYLSELAQASHHDGSTLALPRLCAVDWQTSGSGTRGKPWLSARGNITFSLLEELHRPPGELLGLSLVTGVAIAQVLESLTGIRVQLKWPNDLIVGDEKLGGVLTELLSTSNVSTTRVVTGIGINVRASDHQPPNGLAPVALDELADELPSRSQLVGYLAGHVAEAHERFAREGWRPFAESWNRFDYLRDREVMVLHSNGTERAIALGVDEHGALLIESDGVRRAVFTGEVSVRVAAS